VLVSDEALAEGALAEGATGVLLRDAEPERLVAALRALAQGLVVLEPGLARTAFRPRTITDGHPLDALTPRELEVLQLLAQGLPNKSIAQRLEIAERTAKFHVNAILSKLGAENRSEAIVRAARLGLVVL
jgi:DNA-binding NarL/FixJ family response regulator